MFAAFAHAQSCMQYKLILDLCVSSLREGHANLLCIVPILTDVTAVTPAVRIACAAQCTCTHAMGPSV